MKKLFIFAVLSLLLLSFSNNVYAQSTTSTLRASEMRFDQSYQANPKFEYMVRVATTHMSDTFRFDRFRQLYVETRQYDPLGDDTINQMQNLAYKVQTGGTPEEQAKALDEYRALVMEHLANIRVVVQALSFSKLDSRFGSPNFFTWLRKGIMRDILAHGDGQTLRTAYSVITMNEETALIGQLGYTVLDTQSANEGMVYYNMHDVEDIRTGQKKTLFVNTTHPLRFMKVKQHESGKSYSILKQ